MHSAARVICLVLAVTVCLWAPSARGQQDEATLFEQALVHARDGRFEDAIRGFQALLAVNPQLDRARLELAEAYRRVGNFDAAEGQARHVLRQPGVPEVVRENIEGFLTLLQQDRSAALAGQPSEQPGPHQWRSSLAVSAGYDDNVNAGPGGGVIPITISDFTLTQPSPRERDDFYLRFVGQLNHSYRIADGLGGGKERDLEMDVESGLTLYRQQYFSEADFNADFVSLRTGLSLRKPNAWRVGLYPQYSLIRLDDRLLAHFYGVHPTFSWEANQRAPLFVNASIERRDYAQSADKPRNSTYYSVGVTQFYVPPSFTWLFTTGATIFHENARTENFDNTGVELEGEARWLNVGGPEVYARAFYRRADYEGTEPLFARGRQDDELELELGAEYSIDDWTLKLRGIRKKVESSIALFEYRRSQIEFTLTRRW